MAKDTREITETAAISAIEKSLSKKNIDEFINAWTRMKGHYAEFYTQTLKLVKKYIDEEECFIWAKQLVLKKETRNLACLMLSLWNPYMHHKEEVKKLLLTLGNDENWGTRESAAYVFASVLLKNFDDVYPLFQDWVRSDSENVRRAIVLAAKYVAKARKPEFGEPLLRLIEPLINDRSIYVRKNLGPFAIGDGILRAYPALTMQYLEKWSHSSDEQVLWNVAMVFTSAEGAKHCDDALPILRILAEDERRFVWRAVASALRNLGRRNLEKIKPELENWLNNEKRRKVAETALQYIQVKKQK